MDTNDSRTIYFDNAATSFPKPDCVADAMINYIRNVGSNVNRGTYSSAYAAEDTLFSARERIAELFNGGDCRNVIFTANVTTSLNILIKGLLKPGDHVLVSSMEHNAVMRPLTQLLNEGITFDRIPANCMGELDLDSLDSLIKPNTRAIISTHASNVCGTLLPIAELGAFCHDHGLYFIVDTAQTAGVFPIDMEAMNIDALAFTGHKGLLGPQGTGGFVLKPHMVSKITPLICGGTGSISHTEEVPSFMPDRFEPGTMNLPGIYGLNASLTYLADTGIDHIRDTELALTQYFLDGLSSINSVAVIGKKDIANRAPVVSIQLPGLELSQAAYMLDSIYHIQTRVGLHCAPSAHRTLGTFPEGTLRFSFGHTNTKAEIDICLQALEEIIHGIQTA